MFGCLLLGTQNRTSVPAGKSGGELQMVCKGRAGRASKQNVMWEQDGLQNMQSIPPSSPYVQPGPWTPGAWRPAGVKQKAHLLFCSSAYLFGRRHRGRRKTLLTEADFRCSVGQNNTQANTHRGPRAVIM